LAERPAGAPPPLAPLPRACAAREPPPPPPPPLHHLGKYLTRLAQAYSTCHATQGRRLTETSHAAQDKLVQVASGGVVLSGVAALLLAFAFVTLMTRNAAFCVKASCVAQVVMPLGLAGIFFAYGSAGAGIGFSLVSLLFALVFWLWRSQLELCGQLLSVAAACLKENGHLVSATMGLSLLHGLLSAPVIVLVVLATRVGKPVPNPAINLSYTATASYDVCFNDAKAVIDCCAFQMAPLAQVYIAYAGIILSWLTFSVFEVRLFTISHVTARWYYQPAGIPLPGSPVREAVSLATGPHSGSLAMGGAVLAVADALRQSAESGRNNGSFLACVARLIMSCVSALLEAMTRFATVRIAITGERFMDAARGVVDLLSRNMLNSYGVWRFPPMIVSMTAFAISACWSGLLTLIFYAYGDSVVSKTAAADHALASSALTICMIVLAIVSFLLVFICVTFVGSILIAVVDAVYVCYAMDVDRSVNTRPTVHTVFALIPSIHTVVQQPDGEVGYAPQRPQAYAPQPQYVVSQPQPYAMQAPPQYPQQGQQQYAPPAGYPAPSYAPAR